MPVLHAEDLVQCRGHRQVIRGVGFQIDGGVVGLLGPNGAGKTTLLETVCTLLAPVSGSLTLLGLSVHRRREVQALRRKIAFLPQSFGYVPTFTARDFVEYVGWSKGISARAARSAAADALAAVSLSESASKKLRTLSGGMLKRVAIAAAIAHRPELLVLDEPTVGLDPTQRAEFRGIVRSLAETTPVILSTHLTDDVAAMCDEVIVLDSGRIGFQGTPVALAARGDDGCLGDTPLERGYSAVIHPGSPPDDAPARREESRRG